MAFTPERLDGPMRTLERPEAIVDHEQTSAEADAEALRAVQAEEAREAKEAFLEPIPAAEPGEVVAQDPLLIEIEKVLEADLAGSLDTAFPADRRETFVQAGRSLANQLFQTRDKLKPEHVLSLIRAWLLQIPAVNKKAFLETESRNKMLAILRAVQQAAEPAP